MKMKTTASRPDKNRGERSSTCDFRAAEGKERTYSLSFSSEDPYERFFGLEILDHGEGACDMTRLNEIGCVLFNHNRDKVIGKILRAWTENNRNSAEIAFDDDEESEIIRKKVESGTLKGVSVSYHVDRWEEVALGKKSSDGRFTGPCYIARKWTPFEVSIVSVPADATVGVGRELEEPDISGMENARPNLSRYWGITVGRNK